MRDSPREPSDLAVANPGELLRELGELATCLGPALRPAGSDDLLGSLTETAQRLFGAVKESPSATAPLSAGVTDRARQASAVPWHAAASHFSPSRRADGTRGRSSPAARGRDAQCRDRGTSGGVTPHR